MSFAEFLQATGKSAALNELENLLIPYRAKAQEKTEAKATAKAEEKKKLSTNPPKSSALTFAIIFCTKNNPAFAGKLSTE